MKKELNKDLNIFQRVVDNEITRDKEKLKAIVRKNKERKEVKLHAKHHKRNQLNH